MKSNTTITADLLRRAADLIEQHPELPHPIITSYSAGNVEIDWMIHRDDNQRGLMKQIRQSFGGIWEKAHAGTYFYLRQEHEGLRLTITTDREQVCERIVVGTETVTIPAVEAQPERTEVREIIEWHCEPVAVAR
jgi:hypothetical protein